MARDPRIVPKAGDVFDDEKNGARYFIDNAKNGDINLMEVRFYNRVSRASWREWAKDLRPLCLRVVPISPTAIKHGRRISRRRRTTARLMVIGRHNPARSLGLRGKGRG